MKPGLQAPVLSYITEIRMKKNSKSEGKGKSNTSFEIDIADNIESMLKKFVYTDERYIIRRDGKALIPKNRSIEHHKQRFFVNDEKGPNPSAREMINVDAVVLDTNDPKTVEMILEYEYQTNPKDMIRNFLAPFAVDLYKANYDNDKEEYKLDRNRTLVLLIICFPEKKGESNRERVPLEKGEIMRSWLLKIKDILISHSSIKDGEIIIGDELNTVVELTKRRIKELRPK